MFVPMRPLALALLLCAPALMRAQQRTLSWPAVTVTAHLDASGALRVQERQAILFSGDWNGGERSFDIRNGQRFEFNSLTRIDSVTGVAQPLRYDEALDDVDDFAWTGDGRTLRWR